MKMNMEHIDRVSIVVSWYICMFYVGYKRQKIDEIDVNHQ